MKSGVPFHILNHKILKSKLFEPSLIQCQADDILSRFNISSSVSDTEHHYMVLGIAGFRDQWGNEVLGMSCCCAHEGIFVEMECFSTDEIRHIPGKIHHLISMCKDEGYTSGSVVVHLYNNMGTETFVHIKSVLSTLNVEAPAYLVAIENLKTNSCWAFRNSHTQKIPGTGNIIHLGNDHHLLYINNKNQSNSMNFTNPSLPVKFSITQLNRLPAHGQATNDIINQIYRFSYLFQVGQNNQPLPITVYFSKNLAKLSATHKMLDIPSPVKDKMWFL